MQDKSNTDTSGFFRALFWALLVFFLWTLIAPRIFPSGPSPTPKPADRATSQSAGNAAPAPDLPAQAATETSADGFAVVGSEQVEDVVLGALPRFEKDGKRVRRTDSRYPMRVVASPFGASLAAVHLSEHRQHVDTLDRYQLLDPLERTGGRTFRSMAVSQISIDGVPLSLDGLPWKAARREGDSGESAEFKATVTHDGKPVIELVRTFTLPAEQRSELRSDLDTVLEVRNVSDELHQVYLTFTGPVGLTREGRFGEDRKVFTAQWVGGVVTADTLRFDEVAQDQQIDTFKPGGDSRLAWFACANQYFTCTICPVGPDGADLAGVVSQVSVVDLDENDQTKDDATVRWITQRLDLSPQSAQSLYTQLYLGPKDRRAFRLEANADYVRRNYQLQIKEGYGFCTFNFLTDLMISLLNWLEQYVHNFGLAIIIMVIVVRVILHPITKKTQVNMVRMQQSMGRIQPKMEEIKRKHAGDNARMQQEMMKMYREEGVSPFGSVFSCLPMFLQMPIWVALWSSLNNNIAMRCRGFVWWIDDLTVPDRLIPFSEPINVPILPALDGFNLLPILVGVFMFSQQKLMPKPKPAASSSSSSQSQQAEQMQKIMPYMSLIMILFFYGFPSGLNLYIMTSSLIGTAEQIYIRKHIKEQDLDAGSGGPGGRGSKKRRALPGSGLWGRLQAQAEEARKQATSGPKASKKR